MNGLKVFNFESNEVRTQLIDGEPWFIGKDVSDLLGYSNSPKTLKDHVDEDDKLTERIVMAGQNRDVTIINESGLYSLIIKSKLPNAKKFKRWVTSEVLPSIRKHGGYLTPDKIEEALLNPDILIQLATNLKEERTKRLVAEQRINEMQPKADYYDSILANNDLIPISLIAKNYGMSANKFNKLLNKLGVQYPQSGTWLLYSKYQNEGYTHTEMKLWEGSSKVKPNTKWKQKGHLFLYQLLKENDILPLIEQTNTGENQ